jgi:hypothetical protein
LNFSEIATEDDKDEDKASLPDTEVGEVEAKETAAENAEKNVEEETPETAAKQGEPEKMDTTVREDKLDTTVREDKMDTTVQGDKNFAVSFCDFLVCEKNIYTICVKSKSKSKKLYLFRSYPT